MVPYVSFGITWFQHQIVFFQVLDFYWHCPESRGVWYKSRQLKRRFALRLEQILSRAEGWWMLKSGNAEADIPTEAPRVATQAEGCLNPQPSTLISQPSALNPQPSTLNPQPSALNPQPSTLNPQLSTLNSQPSTINPLLSTLSSQPSTIHHQN